MTVKRASRAQEARGGRTYAAHRRARRRARAIAALVILVALTVLIVTRIRPASPESRLPLKDDAVIREQAAEKHLDPALIAAVIYAETKFQPRTSSAGALGLMQILPATASFIAHLSGGVSFTTSDLATPAINVAYGSWYLRYLLDHYRGDEMLAVAAYNAGLANVDEWLARAHTEGHGLTVADIPFPETSAYVRRVMSAQVVYRATYPEQLGLP